MGTNNDEGWHTPLNQDRTEPKTYRLIEIMDKEDENTASIMEAVCDGQTLRRERN